MAGTLRGLYTGTGSFDIVGHRKRWYIASGLLVTICVLSILLRGFNLGIDFEGGTSVQMSSQGAHGPISTQQVEQVFGRTIGVPAESVQTVGAGAASSILIRANTLAPEQTFKLKAALFDQLQPLGRNGQPSRQSISDSAVSASWGGEISQKALVALLVFLVLVSIFLAVYFEPRMAGAALVALLHDVLVTAGIYSLVGFEVTPASVIGLLTILGFSLYDTVVVFDKVQENTRGLLGLTRRTYAEAANLAVNQTLMRSINTSLIAVLPVLGLLIVGFGLLGVGTLKDLALVQMVGILAGAMSSIFLATPLLVDLTMRKPAYQQQAQRVEARRAKVAGRAVTAEGDGDGAAAAGAATRREGAMAP
ncbi:MAG TPA: protein translocase subunit SecF, partial [Pseudonocardiaceae bacterium]